MSYFKIIKLDATPSTNNYLKNKYKNRDARDGDLVWTKNQTSGRGQRENAWFSKPVESLTFSIFKRHKDKSISNPFILSILVSLGIHEALSTINLPHLKIKWPNDILSCNKKVGGILIENFFNKGELIASVIGLGLNLNQLSFNNLPNATSLRLVSGNFWDQNELLSILTQHLYKYLYKKDFHVPNELINQYNENLWRRNQRALFESKSKNFVAIPKGVTFHGKLIIETTKMGVIERDSEQIRMLYNIKGFQDSK
jgi:BirA family biotin operon repressor/biotin-[acetyl-CoA-carboxylase] ligase